MSRVAKKPIAMPKGVELSMQGDKIIIKGPKGSLNLMRPSHVKVEVKDGFIVLQNEGEGTALAGTLRALLNNVVVGVSKGFERKLELVGVGYRAALAGKDLNLTLGFSHPVVFKAPEGITLTVPSQTEILIQGTDKQRVGEVAAKIRAFRPPEPYKGKGVRYSGEKITIKEAKKA
jgi:large subunit ribosomal protein L6